MSPVAPGEWFKEECDRIAAEQPIAVHVRWGDYLNLKRVYGTVPASYYKRSIDLIESTSGTTRPIWLFSDDPGGASSFLADSVRVDRVVRPPETSSALENLLLLGLAASLVCANSSFSWWAAFVASSQGSIPTVFPRPLFGEEGPSEPKNLLQRDWIQIGR